jgi:c-di-GMP-binding flagellar brake protein YcgR
LETKTPNNLERRHFRRLNGNIFLIINLSSDSNNCIDTSIRQFKSFTKNIGAGGLMFETEEDIVEESKELAIEIYQPLNCDKTLVYIIPVLAKVIWTERIAKEHFENGENKFKVGIEFIKIKDRDRQKILKYINMAVVEKNC